MRQVRSNDERLQLLHATNMARHPAYPSLTDISEDVFGGMIVITAADEEPE